MILGLAAKSLRNRKFTALLTALSIALSVLLLLGVERIRQEARESFAATVSGTDLLVGARTSPVHLLLSAIFHVGNATNNIAWSSYREIAARAEVAWAIPISLGDSHRGYRVLGTTPAYFEHFRFVRDRRLAFEQGSAFAGDGDAVIGADVAHALKYRVGDAIVIAHGAGEVSFALHDDHPFRISGILARTGTPVDRTVHVTLAGLDAVHDDVAAGSDPLAAIIGKQSGSDAPKAITAFLVGLKSRSAALAVQRAVNEFPGEPLTAVLPGVALQEIWQVTAVLEKSLLAVSALVVIVGLSGMLVSLLTSIGERRREMAVLRSLGARPAQVFALILGEAAFLTAAGIVLGMIALEAGLVAGRPWLESRMGFYLASTWPSAEEWLLAGVVAIAGVACGLIPAWRSYRQSLADGMIVRI
ncbi:MAG TPA: ABC transporter permease [Burkholderiales bacterium]|nr:ABC transporter permease [Burkholderiales bacterium]